MSKKKTKMTFDEAFAELQTLLQQIEEGTDLPLEEVAEKVKRSAELIQFCRERLRGIDEDLADTFQQLETMPGR
jgi:exodeoxyribonuclease VII small subunit